MRRLFWFVLSLLLAAVIALPWLRSEEHADLDAQARTAADGQFLTLSHGQVHYRVDGPATGAPVLLVHGFSVPSYVFGGTRDALAAAGNRVVSFDLYGRGWSDRPDLVYDRDLFADQLGDLMTALEIPRADVIGVSMGGAIAGRFTARHPDRVHRLVLIDPVTQAGDVGPLAWPVIGRWLFGAWYLPHLRDSQLDDFAHPEHFLDWPQRFRTQMQYRGFGRALYSTGLHLISQPSLPDFAEIGRQPTPVLLVWGRNDTTTPFAQSADVQHAIPQAQFLSVDDAAHLPHLEQPALVNPALVAFLTAASDVAADTPADHTH